MICESRIHVLHEVGYIDDIVCMHIYICVYVYMCVSYIYSSSSGVHSLWMMTTTSLSSLKVSFAVAMEANV